ncbi:MAG: HisA/HisF-related TIM barrel protein [Rhodoferax sp.]|nr:HisA/HisF-related TIM barrel protein [Rhodoferax sp.]MDP3651338.1 HisA/HisF-related TIM barrel protein [Rhodoferax sp.]
MLKKRLIFTLLYCQGQFMLSRNFRLQNVGNLNWLRTNYNFSHISFSIDELVVLDVTRQDRNTDTFCDALKALSEGCFVPIAAGGGVRTIEHARALLRSGADKVVINSALYGNNDFVSDLASEFGQQCVVASMDIKRTTEGAYQAISECGSKRLEGTATRWVEKISRDAVGEIYLNSIDQDGTGQGYDVQILDLLPKDMSKPVILAGGVGNAAHLAEGLADPRVDAVATAHLFNFVGDGLKHARNSLISSGVDLPIWNIQFLEQHLKRNKVGISN